MAAKKVSKVKSVEVQKQEEEPKKISPLGLWMRANKGSCTVYDWKAVMK
jgi:hypothetical protein